MVIWLWLYGYGCMVMVIWLWLYGYGYMVMVMIQYLLDGDNSIFFGWG